MKTKILAAVAVLVATLFIYAGAQVTLADDSHAQDEEARTVSHFVALGTRLQLVTAQLRLTRSVTRAS